MVNEVALVLLWGLFGWKIALNSGVAFAAVIGPLVEVPVFNGRQKNYVLFF